MTKTKSKVPLLGTDGQPLAPTNSKDHDPVLDHLPEDGPLKLEKSDVEKLQKEAKEKMEMETGEKNIPVTAAEREQFMKEAKEGYADLQARLLRLYKEAERSGFNDSAYYLFKAIVVMLELDAMFFNRSKIKSVSSTSIIKGGLKTAIPETVTLIPEVTDTAIDGFIMSTATFSVELSQWTRGYGHPNMGEYISKIMTNANDARIAALYLQHRPTLKAKGQ